MTTLKRISLLLLAMLLLAGTEGNAKGIGFGVSFNYFYGRLNPYGDWIELDRGVVVWRPMHVHRGWSPYMRGTWVWTDCGWYWDSYESYGDIVYHYGRWYYDDYYGWLWVPDYQWAPAWVEWRYDDDYVGWAPLPPYAEFGYRTGLHFSINFNISYHHFHFVRYNHFGHAHQYNYYENDRYKYRIYNNTRVRNEYGYERERVINRGVDRDFIERRGQVKVREREVSFREDDNRPDNMVRNSGSRIEITVPRERDNSANDNISIKRGERGSSMNTERVTIGRVTRNTNESSGTVRTQTERGNSERNAGTVNNTGNSDRVRQNTPQVEREPQVDRPSRTPDTRREAPAVRPENRNENRAPVRIENRNSTPRESVRERSNTNSRQTESRSSGREERKETQRGNRER